MKSHLSPALQRREDQAQNPSNNDIQTLVLLCDSSHAKLFLNRGPHDRLHLLDEEAYAIPKAGDLVSNARGRNKAGKDSQAHHAYEPPSDAREMEKANFIHGVSDALNEQESNFSRLIIIAPPAALHHLRDMLSAKVQAKIIKEINKDLMHETAATLPHFLKDIIELKNSDDFIKNGAGEFGAS